MYDVYIYPNQWTRCHPGSSETTSPQEPLPPPKVARDIDPRQNDYELFQKYVLPNGGLCAIGDMWPDAARRIDKPPT